MVTFRSKAHLHGMDEARKVSASGKVHDYVEVLDILVSDVAVAEERGSSTEKHRRFPVDIIDVIIRNDVLFIQDIDGVRILVSSASC